MFSLSGFELYSIDRSNHARDLASVVDIGPETMCNQPLLNC